MEIINFFKSQIGKDKFEYNIPESLSDNLNSMEEFYVSSILTFRSKDEKFDSCLARVKDINSVIRKIVKGRDVKSQESQGCPGLGWWSKKVNRIKLIN